MPSRLDVDRQLAADQSAGGAAVQRPCRLLLHVSSGLLTAIPCALSPTARRGKSKLGELRHPNLQLQRAAGAPNSLHCCAVGSRSPLDPVTLRACLDAAVIRLSFNLDDAVIEADRRPGG